MLMNTILLYRPNTEHERAVIEFDENFRRQTGRSIKKMDADSPEGAELIRLYEILRLPAVLARTNDGLLLKLWQDDQLPLINEVSYYSREMPR